MKNLPKLSFKQRLWIPLAITWVLMIAMMVTEAFSAREAEFAARSREFRSVTESAFGILNDYERRIRENLISREDAQNQAKDRIRAVRFGTDGYVAILNFENVVIMHPIKPELEGKNMTGVRDQAGNPLYDAVTSIARSEVGEGELSYLWEKPGTEELVLKTNYTKGFKKWGWALTVGGFVDDIERDFRRRLAKSVILLLVIGLIATFLIAWLVKGIYRELGGEPAYAKDIARSISAGDFRNAVKLIPLYISQPSPSRSARSVSAAESTRSSPRQIVLAPGSP
ncbi:cache domain-containing protein, partial [Cupriavidus numazuensis]